MRPGAHAGMGQAHCGSSHQACDMRNCEVAIGAREHDDLFVVVPRLDGPPAVLRLNYSRRVASGHPRFRRIDTISPRNHVHHFRLVSPADVDAEFQSWLRDAYAVGAQEHLESRRGLRTGR